jgi:hypothetical protein
MPLKVALFLWPNHKMIFHLRLVSVLKRETKFWVNLFGLVDKAVLLQDKVRLNQQV